MPVPVIWTQSSELQFLGASMWTLRPSIWKEIPLPAWAAVLAINRLAAKYNVFIEASISGLVMSCRTLSRRAGGFRDLRHRKPILSQEAWRGPDRPPAGC